MLLLASRAKPVRSPPSPGGFLVSRISAAVALQAIAVAGGRTSAWFTATARRA